MSFSSSENKDHVAALARIVEKQAIEKARCDDEIAHLKDEIARLKGENDHLKGENDHLKGENARLMALIERAVSAETPVPAAETAVSAANTVAMLPPVVGGAGIAPMPGGLISAPQAQLTGLAWLRNFKPCTRFRHTATKLPTTWHGMYIPERGGIVCDETVFTSISAFALAHYQSVDPARETCNGKVECEYMEGTVWKKCPTP